MRLTLDRRRFLSLMAAGAALPAMSRFASAASPFAFQASWINDAEFTGYFVAMDKGYYAEEGLDLSYASGGPDVIPESTIIAGKADLTLTTPDTTIKAIAEQGRTVQDHRHPVSEKPRLASSLLPQIRSRPHRI